MPRNISKKVIERFRVLDEKYNKDGVVKVSFTTLSNLFGLKPSQAKMWLRYSNKAGYISEFQYNKNEVSFVINWSALGVLPSNVEGNKKIEKDIEKNKPTEKAQEHEGLKENEENKTTESRETRLCENKNKTSLVEVKNPKEGINVFTFENELYQLKVVDIEGEIYFLAEEVGNMLGYSNYRDAVYRHVDFEDRVIFTTTTPEGKKIKKLAVNESGLYALIFGSELPEAKRFKKWVTKEVLPSIRKYGAYVGPDKVKEIVSNPKALINLLQGILKHLDQEIALEQQCETYKPYVEYAKQVEKADNSISIEEWAKSISKQGKVVIGRNTAFRWLKEKGYLRKNNMPYQRWINQGYFEVIPSLYVRDGVTYESFTTRITPKGQIALTEKIIEDFA